MAILLSHNTARWYWRYFGFPTGGAPTSARVNASRLYLDDMCATRRGVERCFPGLLGGRRERPVWLARPIDLLVAPGSSHPANSDMRAHVCRMPLAPGCVVRVAEDVYVTSPEFTFLQLGRQLSVGALVQYAMELCGSFVVAPWSSPGFLPQVVFSSVEGLDGFVDEHSRFQGSARAHEALKYAAPGAASPAEVRLYLLLTLPRKLYGYGLPRPILNARLDIPSTSQRKLHANYLRPDLLFSDSRQIVEYDSQQFHNHAGRLDYDDDRREVLEQMGYGVSVVRARRLEDYRSFDEWVRDILAPRLGVEVPPSNAAFLRCIQNLRDELRADLVLPS